MNGFRLLTVERHDEQQLPLAVRPPNGGERYLRVAPAVDEPSDATWVSVITGRNGLGKSRTLGGVASLFAGAPHGRLSARGHAGKEWRVKYVRGPNEVELWASPTGEIHARMNGRDCTPSSAPLPSRVIALSTTAMDKFPLPPRGDGPEDASGEGVYRYLGLRDRTGRAYAAAVVYRALEALVEATEASHERRSRISDVFDFLRYVPRVEHTYRWRYGAIPKGANSLLDLLEGDPRGPAGTITASRLRQMVARDPSALGQLQKAIDRSLSEASPRMGIRLVADFREMSSESLARFRDAQLLKRAGLVYLESVELEHSETGVLVDLREVSSGELSVATTLLGLAAVIEDDALVMIDEPEVSLHPEWQSQYLMLLTKLFSKYRGCHFVVATHSPLIVSGIPPEWSTVISLDPDRERSDAGLKYAGDSIDEVLVRAFDVADGNNLFVKQRLVKALRLAADGEIMSPEFSSTLGPLVPLLANLSTESPTKDLIEQLVRAREGGGA